MTDEKKVSIIDEIDSLIAELDGREAAGYRMIRRWKSYASSLRDRVLALERENRALREEREKK